MVDRELVDELDSVSLQVGGVDRLPLDIAHMYVQGLANEHVVDSSILWWWKSLKGPALTINYGDGDGLALVAEILGDRRDARLVVSDDSGLPWPVYSGDVKKILEVLRREYFFEYILAAHDMSWVVFDTHSNELVIVGLSV
ncbi:hypothetical protein [Bradyrhizobium aeschynomenes]|uniref:hypothetical protein n=1 Tax=Bradyrhizobium aeschynomenes TaxID=2734909 RepID=UPI001553D3A6|nr:hypothetical protein [Bradyrhizobium aeschynomenes]NPV21796.1 hypothetical protein [Bradyrhizobium aeschynomenes]